MTLLRRSRFPGKILLRLAILFMSLVFAGSLRPLLIGPRAAEGTGDRPEMNLLSLLEATESTANAKAYPDSYDYRDAAAMTEETQPLWPVYTFLWAEVCRLRGEIVRARNIYQSLVEWSSRTPYGDESGGSGLAVVSLWRWLQLADAPPVADRNEKEVLFTSASKFWRDQPQLAWGMFEALPQLKENLLRSMTALAWSLNRKEAAQNYFVEYLTVARSGELTPTERELFEEAVSSRELSLPKMALLLGSRLEHLGEYQGASDWLNKARDTGKSQVRAEASLHLALLRRLHGEKCLTDSVKELLDTAIEGSSDPEVIQESLYRQALIAVREGCPKDPSLFEKNLQQILKDFPQGRLADDALNQLGCYRLDLYCGREDQGDLDAALQFFARLRRNYPDRQDFIDSSWFKPAMALYARGNPEDRLSAISLLKNLEKERPDGPLHLAALFWLGRMSEESGDPKTAKAYFETLIRECPYDYYAIRARMHLGLGRQANGQLNPDDSTRDEIHTLYHKSKNTSMGVSERSAYHLRLQAAVRLGIYYQVLRSYINLRRDKFPSNRLESIPLEELDRFQRMPHIALLLAFRQDALTAVDTPFTTRNRLEVANLLSNFKALTWPQGDWPSVIYITGAGGRPFEVKSRMQNNPAYLAVAYPKTFGTVIKKYSDAYRFSGSLLYAIIRSESAFETTALSGAGALGLFQFIPPTFNTLDNRWHVLQERNKSSREEFLLDADASIYLGARWFREELMRSQKDNIVLALMEHNAGYPAVKEWKQKWLRLGKMDDLEFMIETTRYAETRRFVRGVLSTYWIADAAGIY